MASAVTVTHRSAPPGSPPHGEVTRIIILNRLPNLGKNVSSTPLNPSPPERHRCAGVPREVYSKARGSVNTRTCPPAGRVFPRRSQWVPWLSGVPMSCSVTSTWDLAMPISFGFQDFLPLSSRLGVLGNCWKYRLHFTSKVFHLKERRSSSSNVKRRGRAAGLERTQLWAGGCFTAGGTEPMRTSNR